MHHYEVTICTPRGCYHMIIAAGNQTDALMQAEAIAHAQGGYVGGGHHARQID